jgi:phage terminase large subunit-like protein
MGMRGPGGRGNKRLAKAAEQHLSGDLFEAWEPHASQKKAWQEEGLSRAERVIAFIETLPCTKGFGAGEPLKLLNFQKDWIRAVYAENEQGARPVRQGLLSCGRGNGKSVLIAGLCLAHLVGPEAEQRGEVYSAAATKEQAAIIFSEMEATIFATPWMDERLNVKRFGKEIEDEETGSRYKALASDAPAAHGLASSFIACDECAQWKRRELFDVLRTSMGKREEPLMAIIGTQSPHAQNIMSELVDYSVRIETGEFKDPSFYGAVYAVEDDADPYDEENWYKANPALGVFRSLEEIRTEAERAQRMATFEPAFRNLYLNQRVDAEPKAINPAEWSVCGGAVDIEALRGKRCFGGLDLSSTRDLTALVLYFPDDDGAVLPFFWCPKDNLAAKEEQDHVPYRTWANQGHIFPTPGQAIDKTHIVHILAQLAALYDIEAIAYDRFGFQDLKALLDREGIALPLEQFGQGFVSMAPAVDALETLMLSGKMTHANHPVLTWCASNAVFDTDPAGNRKFSKNRSIDRIDGVVALAMAIGQAAKQPEEPKITFGAMVV